MKIKKYIIIMGFIFSSISLSYGEVWGGSEEVNTIAEPESTVSVPQKKSVRSDQLKASRDRLGKTYSEDELQKQGMRAEDRYKTSSERVEQLRVDIEKDRYQLVAFILSEYLHQENSFVISPKEKFIYSHYSPFIEDSNREVILGAREKVEQYYTRQYRPLRTMEFFNNRDNIKDLREKLKIDEPNHRTQGGEDGVEFYKDKSSQLLAGYGLEKGDKQTVEALQSFIQGKMSGIGSAVNFSGLKEGLDALGVNSTSSLNFSGMNMSQLGIADSVDIKGMQAQVKKEFGLDSPDEGSDEDISCKALLCLMGGGSDSECQESIQEYLRRTLIPNKPDETITKRKNFLEICPTDNNKNSEDSQNDEYPGQTGFSSLINVLGDGAAEKCSMDRHGMGFKPFIKDIDNPDSVGAVWAYNDEIRTIHFDWTNPTSDKYPDDPTHLYEMVVKNDRLPKLCEAYVTHEYVNIYKTPIYERALKLLDLPSDEWIGSEGVGYLSRSTNDHHLFIEDKIFGRYSKYITSYLRDEVRHLDEKDAIDKVSTLFRDLKESIEWKKAREEAEGSYEKNIRILNDIPYVYDLLTDRRYYFGSWKYVQPLNYVEFMKNPIDPEDEEGELQKMIKEYSRDDDERLLQEMVDDFKKYRGNLQEINKNKVDTD